jgi:hypothetical protein
MIPAFAEASARAGLPKRIPQLIPIDGVDKGRNSDASGQGRRAPDRKRQALILKFPALAVVPFSPTLPD